MLRVLACENTFARQCNGVSVSRESSERNAPSETSTVAFPMRNADEPIFFKCTHIESVGRGSFDRTAFGAKPLSFLFLRWVATNGVG